jgi:purine-binding chemotaxis protein CheW
VIDLRGHLIPMIDLRKRFGLAAEIGAHTRIVILRVRKMRIGLIVDSAHDVITVPFENIEAPPPIARMHTGDYVLAVAKNAGELYLILNLDRILSSAEEVRLHELSILTLGKKDVSIPGS